MASDSLTISLSEPLKSFVEEQAAAAGYSPGDYILSLINAERIRKAQATLEAALVEGLNSGPSIPVDQAYWKREKELFALPPRTAKPG